MNDRAPPVVLAHAIVRLVLPACATIAASAQIQFTEEAVSRGLVYDLVGQVNPYAGFGVGLADLDGDHDLDLIVLGATTHRAGIFENDGTGHFTDRSLTCGLPLMPKAEAFAAVDLDGDGLLDLVFGGYVRVPAVFRNQGDFTFTDISASTGMSTLSITAGITGGDIDGDGWVDLFIAHYAYPVAAVVNTRNQLWRNNGDLTFTDVAPLYGLNIKAYSFLGAIVDADEDGDLDIYVSNDRGWMPPPVHPNRYYRRTASGFDEIGQQNGTGLGFFSMGVAVGDFTNDAITDFYCANSPGNVPPLFGKFPLFRGSASGIYNQGQEPWGVSHWGVGWACIFFDADNDGHQDLFVANQSMPNCLYRNPGSPPAVDVTISSGLGIRTGPSFGAAVGDVNGDGLVDLVVNPLGQNMLLFINQSDPTASFVDLKIVGEGHDLDALGASVRLTAGGSTQLGHVLQGSNGFLGQNGLDVHFGLGSSRTVDSMTIRWPNSGSLRTLANYPANTRWTIHPPGRMGDVDGDGAVTQADLSALAAACGGAVEPGLEMLDMNGDGTLGGEDRLLMLAALQGPPGDFDGNGAVDGLDLGLLLAEWKTPCSPRDLTGDFTVDGDDLGTLLGAWGG